MGWVGWGDYRVCTYNIQRAEEEHEVWGEIGYGKSKQRGKEKKKEKNRKEN